MSQLELLRKMRTPDPPLQKGIEKKGQKNRFNPMKWLKNEEAGHPYVQLAHKNLFTYMFDGKYHPYVISKRQISC